MRRQRAPSSQTIVSAATDGQRPPVCVSVWLQAGLANVINGRLRPEVYLNYASWPPGVSCTYATRLQDAIHT